MNFKKLNNSRSKMRGSLLFKIVPAIILAVGGFIGYQIYSVYGSTPSDEKVQSLANEIVDPRIGAAELETKGFHKTRFGGMFLDDCRKSVLRDDFNKDLPNSRKAQMINNCMYQSLIAQSQGTSLVIRNR